MASSVIHTKFLQLPTHLHYSLPSPSSSAPPPPFPSSHLCLLRANLYPNPSDNPPTNSLLAPTEPPHCLLSGVLVFFNLATEDTGARKKNLAGQSANLLFTVSSYTKDYFNLFSQSFVLRLGKVNNKALHSSAVCFLWEGSSLSYTK